ncbi:MAG: arsenite methyltransferase [Candidatus Goldbacteria bacterium]|nr:arsenite methyltransferase [Candidatus Goldiibacteriota bacterium]
MQKRKLKKIIKQNYAKIAIARNTCCGAENPCCGDAEIQKLNMRAGYKKSDLKKVPEKSNMGLGCGNPVALASLKKGETVLDLGSGGGLDCFLAAKKVGKKGKVIGIDMTPEMIKKAEENAKKGKYKNVKFILGEIEKIPLPDYSIDIVMSNCVINLSPEKEKVFKEIFRVLKRGGRMIISDIVLKKKLPEKYKKSINLLVGCVSNAILMKDYLKLIKKAGFKNIKILEIKKYVVNNDLKDYSLSITVSAIKI